MPQYSHLALQWKDTDTPVEVRQLQWPLIAWLEAAVGRDARDEGLATGATVQGMVRDPDTTGPRLDVVSKYKVVPFADVDRSAFRSRGSGVAVGLDRRECELVFGDPRATFAQLPWLGTDTFETAGHSRDYWWIALSAAQTWEERRLLLQQIRFVIDKLEEAVRVIR